SSSRVGSMRVTLSIMRCSRATADLADLFFLYPVNYKRLFLSIQPFWPISWPILSAAAPDRHGTRGRRRLARASAPFVILGLDPRIHAGTSRQLSSAPFRFRHISTSESGHVFSHAELRAFQSPSPHPHLPPPRHHHRRRQRREQFRQPPHQRIEPV